MSLDIHYLTDCFTMERLQGTGVPEVIASKWFTPIALAMITATGVLFLVATTLPPMVVLDSVFAMSALILILRNCCGSASGARGAPSAPSPEAPYVADSGEHSGGTDGNGGNGDVFMRDPSATQYDPICTDERSHLITHLLQNNPLPQGVNDAHLRHSLNFEGDTISIPNGCTLAAINLNELTELFDAMNTTDKWAAGGTIRSDYVDRSSSCVVSDSTTSISYAQARSNIETIVQQVEHRENFMGIPRSNPAKEEFFIKLETYLKVIIHEIRSGNHDTSMCNDIILQCTTSADHCGGRYMSAFSEGYERLITRVAFSSYKDIALEELHALRRTIVMQMTLDHPECRGAFQPHVLNAHMINVGHARGIRGTAHLTFDDIFAVLINQEQSIREFDALYTSPFLQARFEEMVNGARIMDSTNQPSHPAKFNVNGASIGKERTYGWLENHVPPEWAPSIRDASTGNIARLTPEQVEALFGASLDQTLSNVGITGEERLQAIRNLVFKMSCTSSLLGNVKAVACTYVLNQLGVLNSQIDWTELHMDTDVLNNLFSYSNDEIVLARITF